MLIGFLLGLIVGVAGGFFTCALLSAQKFADLLSEHSECRSEVEKWKRISAANHDECLRLRAKVAKDLGWEGDKP